MMLAVASDQIEQAKQVLQSEWVENLGHEYPDEAESVVDLDAEETTCPACGASFRPESARCPECDLSFGD